MIKKGANLLFAIKYLKKIFTIIHNSIANDKKNVIIKI